MSSDGDRLLAHLFAQCHESATHIAVDATGRVDAYKGQPTLDYAHQCHAGPTVAHTFVLVNERQYCAKHWKSMVFARAVDEAKKPVVGVGEGLFAADSRALNHG